MNKELEVKKNKRFLLIIALNQVKSKKIIKIKSCIVLTLDNGYSLMFGVRIVRY